MMLFDLIHKAFYKLYRKLINSVIIITVLREVAFYLIIGNYTVLISYNLYLGILDST